MNAPQAVRDAFPGAILIEPDSVANASSGKGAYALIIHLRSPVMFMLRGAPVPLPPGTYVYAGSAHGPGGLRARLARHFRIDKKPHWHIDHLTRSADGMAALAAADLSECEIIARLGGTSGFFHPLPGFGSSDCSRCRSHLLAYRR